MLRLTLLLCALAGPALAEWTFVQDWTDPLDSYDTRAAATTNADGYQLHLYRNPVGRVYALITLPDTAPDLLREGVVATLTPHGFKPKEITAQSEPGRIVEYATSTGRSLRDRLWHGEGQAPAFGTFHDLLEADGLKVSLTHADQTETTTEWSMKGAANPIAQALGVSIDGVPAGDAWEDAASHALLAAMTACQFPKLDVVCVQMVTLCSAKISDDRDIDGFEGCLVADSE